MPKLSKTDISHIARLSNLKLSKAEISLFENQLSSILDFVSQLKRINTEEVEATSQVTSLTDVLRSDEPKISQLIKEGFYQTKLISKKNV